MKLFSMIYYFKICHTYQSNIFDLFQVFLVLWWWLFFLVFVGFSRFGFRIIQIYSARLRFYMLKMRMQRYFKRSASTDKIKNYICKCSRGDWFVLYQLSKNLNRVFFMDFLVTLARTVDPESPARDEQGDEGNEKKIHKFSYYFLLVKFFKSSILFK